ncbi:MAG TPA: hypothetical protein VH744_09575 [Terriglobales bacterium]|jgi:hypothetical protein
MLQRFVAGSSMGALVIALGALVVVSIPGLPLPRMWPLTTMWCFVPFAWGIWMLLTPRAWLPERLPYWGAILGFVGGTMSAFVLNLPSRIFDVPVSFAGRLVAVAIITVLYYFLWMLVRATYRSLVSAPPGAGTAASGPQLKKAA